VSIDVMSYPGVRADDRGWGSGWPHCQESKWVTAPKPIFGQVHKEILDLVTALVEESQRRGFHLKGDGLSAATSQCWGAQCRPIKKLVNGVIVLTDIPSNHSWGLAVDINAPDNPLGGTSHTIPGWMAQLWNDYGFRWGGDYPNTKDWMHFEFMGTPQDAKTMTAKAKVELGGGFLAQANVTQEEWDELKARVTEIWNFIEGASERLQGETQNRQSGGQAAGLWKKAAEPGPDRRGETEPDIDEGTPGL
jgi:D-alanyl-D-alanine carboxypeptidase